MDLQLTDEQRWLAESVDELLARAGDDAWPTLVEFGALEIGGNDGLGVVELALVARAIGSRLAAVPFAESAAVRFVADLGAVSVTPCLDGGAPTTLHGDRVTGERAGVAFADSVELLAVPAAVDGDDVVLAIVPAAAATTTPEATLDPTLRPARVHLDRVAAKQVVAEAGAVSKLAAVGGILVSAEAVGAAASVLELARDYAGQRRQFGLPIGSFQAVRHLLADMYVGVESSWSSVLYAAASLDESDPDSHRTASIAKAYTTRATQQVAQGALQVFGGIAFTAEHPAHRYLRRILARGAQFGSARDHERRLARELATSSS